MALDNRIMKALIFIEIPNSVTFLGIDIDCITRNYSAKTVLGYCAFLSGTTARVTQENTFWKNVF